MGTTDNIINQLRGRKIPYNNEVNESINYAIACIKMHKPLQTEVIEYRKLQADYENRLKADMVAMLEDLDLQIDESAAYNLEVAKVQRLIRDKIDKLRE